MMYFGNKYVPDYCPPDLPWYERDGLLTWYDQNKYAEFSINPDEYLKNKKAIDFDQDGSLVDNKQLSPFSKSINFLSPFTYPMTQP